MISSRTPNPRRTTSALVGLALAAGLTTASTAGLASSASAAPAVERMAPVSVSVSIRLQRGGDKEKLGGVVKSRRATCKQARPVSLHFKEPGKAKFTVVRKDTTSPKGVWVVPAPGSTIPPGRYYAKVAKKGDVCKTDRSATITVR